MSDGMIIAPLTREHFDESMDLSHFAFQIQKTKEELEAARANFGVEPLVTWGAFVDGKLASKATILDMQTYIGGKRFAMGGVAGVATWPEYRRQGLVASLLVHSLQTMKDKGQTISFLAPFAYGFYRKYGWETYCNYRTYTISSSMLPKRTDYSGRIVRCSDYKPLQDMYEAYATQYNGMLSRSAIWWEMRVSKRKTGSIVVYNDNENNAQGYMIYEVKNRVLTIHELVHLNEESYTALWSFVSQHDSMIDSVFIAVPDDDILPFLLDNPRIKQETSPHFMARIVDAKAFIEQLAFKPASQVDKLTIAIDDKHTPWNAGTFELLIDESGAAQFNRIESAEADIQVNIGLLTSMFLGYRRPSELSYFKRIVGNENVINRLQFRIPERTTHLVDFF